MNDPKIYLKLDKRPKNVQDLLKQLYSLSNQYSKNAVETYSNKECTIKQCNAYKSRSFDDIYYLAKTYFHNITPKRLIHELLQCRPGKNEKFRFYHCITMGKIRVTINKNDSNRSYDYTVNLSKYYSRWSWKDLYDMLNIKSQIDLDNYYKKYCVYLN